MEDVSTTSDCSQIAGPPGSWFYFSSQARDLHVNGAFTTFDLALVEQYSPAYYVSITFS